jgi:hypothetical protein
LFDWDRRGDVAIDFAYDSEYAISVPRVFYRKGWEMLYSYRGGPFGATYRIGYAVSENGSCWDRRDTAVALQPSNSGWDSEMVCYPFVINYDGEYFVLYNGNGYGATGFGLARML